MDSQLERATVYKGEAMLIRWSESAGSGRTVTLELSADGETHPFKGLRYGQANGQRLMIAAVLINDQEEPQPHATKAQRSAPESPPERTPFSKLARSTQSGIRSNDTDFQAWLGIIEDIRGTAGGSSLAGQIIRSRCGVTSRKHLDTDNEAAAKWDALETDYSLRAYNR